MQTKMRATKATKVQATAPQGAGRAPAVRTAAARAAGERPAAACAAAERTTVQGASTSSSSVRSEEATAARSTTRRGRTAGAGGGRDVVSLTVARGAPSVRTFTAGTQEGAVVDIGSGRTLLRARRSAREAARRRVEEVRRQLRAGAEAGLATAEYAIATIAAAGFAGLLIVILKSGAVKTMLTDIIHSALSVG